MSKTLDEARTIRAVQDILRRHGFEPRDADGSDWQYPGSGGDLRFKVGMAYGEVTVTVWGKIHQIEAIRITNPNHSWIEAKRRLDGYLAPFPYVNGTPA